MKIALITGSAGLIGAESVRFFIEKDFKIVGIDNDMRAYFFGPEASTKEVSRDLAETFRDRYVHLPVDIRDRERIEEIFKKYPFDLIIHTAAQPSHDWAAGEPYTDFDINAVGTMNLLESCRRFRPEAVFIFTSTNKVYGDTPNQLPLIELETRWELPEGHRFYHGIDESMSIDNSLHSIFGASKTAADLMTQEYGRYFGMKTAVFRGGCLTGPLHRGAELHGFLAYLAKCVALGKEYTVYGYRGKQVRDNIHAFDLVNAFWHFYRSPRCGEVYNIGGSRHANVSMKEAIAYFEKAFRKKAIVKYTDRNRKGDHIWYISSVAKFRSHHPGWNFKYDVAGIMDEICAKHDSRR